MATSQQAIQNLFQSPWQIALCLTGGGSRVVSDLLTVPGASSTLLDVAIPYSTASLADYLRQVPDQSCSRETALRMATVAWQKALRFSEATEDASAHRLGVACAASLASSIPKRGEHRIWIPDKDLDTFGPVIAAAFEMTDQPRLAVQTLNRMLANRPKDVAMRRRVAELLLQTGAPSDISAAQVQFRKLEGTLKAGSDEWMDARIHVIETAIQLKDFEAARKLLKVTQLLYPNPSTDDLKRRLNEASTALASAK